ncbi:MAG: hypothetical protein LQ337_004885 [Flavoplaca oasis]|nr:MAG: hypothetical protein LQ337_004885 [Flavoplaca oasis]
MHDFDLTATAFEYNGDLFTSPPNQEQIDALQNMQLLRVDSSSSVDTPQTVSPAQLLNSGHISYQDTPATDYTNSPAAPWSGVYSHETSPDQGTLFTNEGMDYDPNQLGSAFFPPLPGEPPIAPVQKPSPKQTAAMVRVKSSTKSPKTTLSTVVGSRIRKPAKTGKELKEIRPNPDDPVDVKRARNTAAARKSRARKLERFESLVEENDVYRTQVEELESAVEMWKQRALDHGWPPGTE